jgi:hypothetical protein
LAVKCYRCKTEPPRHFLRARSVTPLQVAQKERRNPRGIILANKRTIKTTQVTTAPRNKVSSGSSGKIERFVNVRYVNNHRPDDVMVARCWSSRLSPEFLPLVSVLATLYDPGNHIGAETQPEILLSELHVRKLRVGIVCFMTTWLSKPSAGLLNSSISNDDSVMSDRAFTHSNNNPRQ